MLVQATAGASVPSACRRSDSPPTDFPRGCPHLVQRPGRGCGGERKGEVSRHSKEDLMLTLLWSLSAAIRGYLRFYMPTNRAVDWLRTARGLKWAMPVALVATPAYLLAMKICSTIVADGGPGYLNVLVVLFFWNAMKFAWMAALSPFRLLTLPLRVRRELRVGQTATSSSELGLG